MIRIEKSIHTFSLIELMVAVALGMMLLGMVTYTLNNASKAASKATIEANFNNRARAINKRFTREIESLIVGANNDLYTTLGTARTYCAFMTGAPTLTVPGTSSRLEHDLYWVRYEWDSTSKTLYRYYDPVDINDATSPAPSPPTPTSAYSEKMPLDFRAEKENESTATNNFKVVVVDGDSDGTADTIEMTYWLRDTNSGTEKEFTCQAFLPGQ
ncbi:MAG: PilW family protein [Planctomycetota bacterium]|jgi:type II secretory pathway pseudopilin PulG